MQISQRVSLVDSVAPITVRGVPAHHSVVVRAKTRNVDGTVFSSRETFRSDAHGEVDLSHDPAVSGSYRGVSPMGLLWAMHPKRHLEGPVGYSDRVDRVGQKVKVSVSVDGQSVASATFKRLAQSPRVHTRKITVQEGGFDGLFFQPASSRTPRPGVVLLGGSEGGLPDTLEAGLLASRGYPTLALAYFKAPGLPDQLNNIPLEYFAKALRWLGHQPGVDAKRLVVSGASRGSEAALLLGVHDPNLVHAVIALVPSNVALCGYPDCSQPAWTLHGKPVPYSQLMGPTPGDPAAVIPVEDINGPLLLDCGGVDQVWPSCPMANAIVHRLQAHRDPHPHVLLSYPHANHYIGTLIPNIAYRAPGTDDSDWTANMKARTRAWPAVLGFLQHLSH
ncbi:MAG TPA: acyl-CoA thioesterase/BAAT N-terminal domain-containing protein [Nocardioidaceae bacterium]|nr:acyl-CoA thioesterase/BAAT N-terminal domain-containing protein [Nocardioidaceae bacterium]